MDVQQTGRPVVVGVDGSESSTQAVRWAAREAAREGAPLRIVQAVGWPTTFHKFGELGAGHDEREPALRMARHAVTAAAAEAAAAAPGVAVDDEVVDGYAIPALLREARTARLAVIGDRGLGGVAGLLLGSVASALAAHGACPVAVVRGRSTATDGPVVVGVDPGSTSEAALTAAFEAAAARSAPLTVVHTWLDPLLDPVVLPSPDWADIARFARAALEQRMAGWSAKYPDVPVTLDVVRNPAARALIERSDGAQLVVVGSRGHGAAGSLLLGSVSHAVLHRADCPVLVVRDDVEDATG